MWWKIENSSTSTPNLNWYIVKLNIDYYFWILKSVIVSIGFIFQKKNIDYISLSTISFWLLALFFILRQFRQMLYSAKQKCGINSKHNARDCIKSYNDEKWRQIMIASGLLTSNDAKNDICCELLKLFDALGLGCWVLRVEMATKALCWYQYQAVVFLFFCFFAMIQLNALMKRNGEYANIMKNESDISLQRTRHGFNETQTFIDEKKKNHF